MIRQISRALCCARGAVISSKRMDVSRRPLIEAARFGQDLIPGLARRTIRPQALCRGATAEQELSFPAWPTFLSTLHCRARTVAFLLLLICQLLR